MKLIDLLMQQDDETIRRLVEEHLAPGEADTRADACINLEATIRSPTHIRSTLYNRRPPCFSILRAALDAGGRIDFAGLRERATEETRRIAGAVSDGVLVGRGGEADLYRRVLLEAWRSDFELDSSEIALLAVLRRELGLRNVDHFLIEHHADLQPLWDTDHAFLDVLNGLRSGGLAHVVDGALVLPAEVVPVVRQVLGIEASAGACRRLFDELSSSVLRDGLDAHRLKASGSKAERIERMVASFVQPTAALEHLALQELRELCSKYSQRTSGAKDHLIDRVTHLFAKDADVAPSGEEEEPPPEPEDRVLSPESFVALLGSFRGQDLSDILASIGSSRVTGSKEHLISLLVESPFSETTLLQKLELKQLGAVLRRLNLRAHGTKAERVARLLAHHRAGPSEGEETM
jgi:hypothetical protein